MVELEKLKAAGGTVVAGSVLLDGQEMGQLRRGHFQPTAAGAARLKALGDVAPAPKAKTRRRAKKDEAAPAAIPAEAAKSPASEAGGEGEPDELATLLGE